MQGTFPFDLILFGMVAAFLVLRLRSVLGKRQGFERPPQAASGPVPASRQEAAAPPATKVPLSGPVAQTVSRIRAVDPGFDPAHFLAGAEGAFRMIVGGFAAGDRATLRNLLADEVYGGFEQAISERESQGHSQRTEVRNIQAMTVEDASLSGTVATITVRFVTDQVNMTTASSGEIVSGSDAITELTDVWTFQRDLKSSDPAWRLVATRSL
ncbi:Tim44 domain-containing protein [Rhodovarius crocodyli]|uniref:Tim44 domain-containing protein n=1 Tax=Rhodovarius crocodyli TaxID=1979269 RepID=A0A437MND9_9PROT|nr:Tim44/TimA family putative adaptor protein [Rhodovarius crocodyli]RVT99156.1 Tim44 domain-containing protein [Rhodovarius crocodyli]